MPPLDTGPEAGSIAGESRLGHPTLVLDACCYVNLFASGRIAEIVRDLPFRFSVVDVAKREVSFVRKGGSGDDAQEAVPVDWDSLTSAGLAAVLTLTGEAKEADYVSLLESIDDGEAATLAVAINRALGVATDERKARRLLASRAPHLPIRSTLDIFHEWCRVRAMPEAEIAELLRNVRERGRFLPPRGDPLTAWWNAHLQRTP